MKLAMCVCRITAPHHDGRLATGGKLANKTICPGNKPRFRENVCLLWSRFITRFSSFNPWRPSPFYMYIQEMWCIYEWVRGMSEKQKLLYPATIDRGEVPNPSSSQFNRRRNLAIDCVSANSHTQRSALTQRNRTLHCIYAGGSYSFRSACTSSRSPLWQKRKYWAQHLNYTRCLFCVCCGRAIIGSAFYHTCRASCLRCYTYKKKIACTFLCFMIIALLCWFLGRKRKTYTAVRRIRRGVERRVNFDRFRYREWRTNARSLVNNTQISGEK